MRDEPKVRETPKTDYGNIISDAPQGDIIKAGEPDVARLLRPGERVVWESQSNPVGIGFRTGLFSPSKEPAATIAEIGHLIHNLGWLVIAFGWILAIVYVVFSGVTIPHILTGIFVLTTLCAVGYMTLKITRNPGRSSSTGFNRYWLTNHRAIIIRKLPFSDEYRTTMIDLAATDAVKMIERGDGSGTIVFGRNAVNTYSPAARGYVSNEADYSFSDIPNVAEVYRLVQEAQVAARNQQG